MKTRTWRHAAAVMAAACAVSVALPATAAVADSGGSRDVPAVDILPVDTTTHDPNQGVWFVFRLKPGVTAHGVAQLINPAHVAQRVTLYPRELDFSSNGTPTVNADPGAGIGSWVRFDENSVVVPPQQRVHVRYVVHVPLQVDPGDHTGVLVAESAPRDSGGHFTLVKRIATRFYVTVPGKVIVAFRLGGLANKLDNVLWPGSEGVHVSVTNTGNTSFVPHVLINGASADGSNLVMTRSVEVYRSTVHVPWYGGPVRIKVTATADGKDQQTLTKTVWVIPWALIAILLVLVVVAWVVRDYVRRRRRRREEQEAARHAEQAVLQSRIEELQSKAESATVPTQRAAPRGGSLERLRSRSRGR